MYWVIRHTVMHHSSTSIYTPNFIEIGKNFILEGLTTVQSHVTQKLGQISKIWPDQMKILCFSLRIIYQLLLQTAEQIDLEKYNLRNFRSPVTLTLTLDRVIRHTIVHHSLTSIYKPNFIEIGKTFCGRTDIRMYVCSYLLTDISDPPLILLLKRSRPKKEKLKKINL